MTFKTRISFRQYYKLLFGLIYKKPVMKIIVAVGFILLIWILGYYSHFLPIPEPEIYQFIALGLISVAQPIGIFWTLKRSFESSNHLGEKLEFETTQAELKIRGESFYTELVWEKLFRIEEVPKYFLIYQNTLTAIIIDKKDLSKEQLHELRGILGNIPKVPVKLKKTP